MSPIPAGIIGGSGLYDLPGMERVRSLTVETPFGKPSDELVEGVMGGRSIYFLARHGRAHTIAPHEINHRANIWALRSLGVRWILAVGAVGSLREEVRPREAVVPDQFLDRTGDRSRHTFFGGGIVAHVGFAEPTSRVLRGILAAAGREAGITVHEGGTYVCMDGPAFSTRAESLAYRTLGGTVIGMTNLPEAKLAREACIAYANLAMVTDYDCWREGEEAVTADAVFAHLRANVEAARLTLAAAIPRLPTVADLPEHRALADAMVTARSFWPDGVLEKIPWILDNNGS